MCCRAALGVCKQGSVDLRRMLQHPSRSGATQLSSPTSDSFCLATLSAAGVEGGAASSNSPSLFKPAIILLYWSLLKQLFFLYRWYRHCMAMVQTLFGSIAFWTLPLQSVGNAKLTPRTEFSKFFFFFNYYFRRFFICHY